MTSSKDLYVVAWESGFGPNPLPTWTDRPGTVTPFEERADELVTRVDIPEVPGAFQLLNVISEQEADNIVEIAEGLGFHQDSPVSLPHDVRHNENMNWVVSEGIDGVIWERSRSLVNETVGSSKPLASTRDFASIGTGRGTSSNPIPMAPGPEAG